MINILNMKGGSHNYDKRALKSKVKQRVTIHNFIIFKVV